MRLLQHEDGFLVQPAPFGKEYFWRPLQAPLGAGATGCVIR